MKVIRQNRTNVDCGIVAAFNATSWCKQNRTYKEVRKIARSCGFSAREGIFDFQFVNLMKKLNLPFCRMKGIHIDQVEDRLYMGKCYLISYNPRGWADGHLVTVFLDKHGKIKVINPEDEHSTWPELASTIYANGMKGWMAYELPRRDSL